MICFASLYGLFLFHTRIFFSSGSLSVRLLLRLIFWPSIVYSKQHYIMPFWRCFALQHHLDEEEFGKSQRKDYSSWSMKLSEKLRDRWLYNLLFSQSRLSVNVSYSNIFSGTLQNCSIIVRKVKKRNLAECASSIFMCGRSFWDYFGKLNYSYP